MYKEQVKETIVFLPLLKLRQVYRMENGAIGPASGLMSDYPTLSKILPAFAHITVDGNMVEDPVFAASTKDYEDFIAEVEIVAFLAASDKEAHAEEEIFGNKIIFTIHRENNRESIGVNNYSWFTPVEALASIKLQDFPRSYSRWDEKTILNFETFLEKSLNNGLYKALVKCLTDSKDTNVKRERARIIISIALFNQAFVHLELTQPFSKMQIVLLAAAFEALLNLPDRRIKASFKNEVKRLGGGDTALLDKWGGDFYAYRSSLAHGDEGWRGEEKTFELPNKKQIDHSAIGKYLFAHCLKTKLSLMGLFPEYVRKDFDFADL